MTEMFEGASSFNIRLLKKKVKNNKVRSWDVSKLEKKSKPSTVSSDGTVSSPSEPNSIPAGTSSASFCQDALSDESIFSPRASQKTNCRKMFICFAKAQGDCMLGSSNVWTSCEMR